MKHLDLLSNYYLMSFLLTAVAALAPLLLHDTSLFTAVLCGRSGRGAAGIKRGLLLRSVSSESDGKRDQERYLLWSLHVASLSLSRAPAARAWLWLWRLCVTHMKFRSRYGILSGPTVDESDREDAGRQELQALRRGETHRDAEELQELQELRQHNRRLQEKVAQLEQELAGATAGARDLL